MSSGLPPSLEPVFRMDSQAGPQPDLRQALAATGSLPFEVHRAGNEQYGAPDQARTVLGVSGEVDLLTSPRLAAAIVAALHGGRPNVVVDLARVEFIDVAGIRVLENAAGEARGAGGGLVLRAPSRAVRRVLGVLDLDRALPVEQCLAAPRSREHDGMNRGLEELNRKGRNRA